MPQASYTCPDVVCDGHGCYWLVEVDEQGVPVEEADARCPDCYAAGLPAARQSAATAG